MNININNIIKSYLLPCLNLIKDNKEICLRDLFNRTMWIRSVLNSDFSSKISKYRKDTYGYWYFMEIMFYTDFR